MPALLRRSPPVCKAYRFEGRPPGPIAAFEAADKMWVFGGKRGFFLPNPPIWTPTMIKDTHIPLLRRRRRLA
ncbi:MAG: hypothetical protein BM560_07335 [Roseobacter sp. MedPE-SWde]|nr:MAG: hypothetical protein BM560_07335 [Roseobacter sp. MedPE-SWde]